MTSDDYPYWSYEEWDRVNKELYYLELLMELRTKYKDMLDKDDMDYPPAEYWSPDV